MKSKTTTAILALFLGGLGAHRFYLGQIGRGFLYLIFCWTFIPCLIAFIDFIIFLTMDENRFNETYNRNQLQMANASFHPNAADELEKLFLLKEKGIITEVEFQTRKFKLLQ
jgi:TM2 domain-containing membrane protein YozV